MMTPATTPGLTRSTRSSCLLAGTAAALAALAALVMACKDEPTGTISRPSDPAPAAPSLAEIGTLSLTLPFNGSVSTSSVPAFQVKQFGGWINGRFEIANSNNSQIALEGLTNGSGHAILGWNLGRGRAGVFITSNTSNTNPALVVSSSSNAPAAEVRASNTTTTHPALYARHIGRGPAGFFEIGSSTSSSPALRAETPGGGTAVLGRTTGTGRAGYFAIANMGSANAALEGSSNGSGQAVLGTATGRARAGVFRIFSVTSDRAALTAETNGVGPALRVNHTGSAGSIALFQNDGTNKARINRSGKGFFNGGTQTGGADVAEAFAVEGSVRDYGPGDVLVISERSDRRVERSAEAYSTLVAGVYATKPGVLLTERGIDDPLGDLVPMGVVGVIPTKVSAENGAIRRGDLLVTAGTPGHAMRGTDRERMLGAVLGKALAPFAGPGTGVIPVLVNAQ